MIISDSSALGRLCDDLAKEPFITIDTEFLRDKTYYPQLCLVQIAAPEGQAYAIDPLARGMDLSPLFSLLANKNVTKVFHAARQDIEIFVNLTGATPANIFDTQVAAMVLGYGDQIGYLNLVQDICKKKLDKGAQFTDWSRRPLTERQLSYALDDVIWLRDVYRHLKNQLEVRGRSDWVNEEISYLSDVSIYQNPPETAWQRLKLRTDKPQAIAILMAVAKWREEEAQRRNVPRGRILKDETLLDLAVHAPRNADELKHIRGVGEDMARGRLGAAILHAVEVGLSAPRDTIPRQDRRKPLPPHLVPVVEMLKVLLRIVAAENEVAARLIASPEDLEEIAKSDKADVPALKGWRYDVFGAEALKMKHGKLALSIDGGAEIRRIVIE
jgi:ribonuclease D